MTTDERPVVAIVTAVESDPHYVFPGYRRVALNEDYHRSVAEAGGVPVLLPPAADRTLVAHQLESADGLLLAGGADVDPLLYGQSPLLEAQTPSPLRDAYEFEALRVAFQRGLPVLGICRGLQLLNVWLGGTLHQDNAHTGTRLRHHGAGEPEHGSHAVDLAPGSVLQAALGKNRLIVNSFHHQSVDRVAAGLSVAARAPDGIVEAVELTGVPTGRLRPSAPVVGVQWDPEMMSRSDADARALFRWFVVQAAGGQRPPRRAMAEVESAQPVWRFSPRRPA